MLGYLNPTDMEYLLLFNELILPPEPHSIDLVLEFSNASYSITATECPKSNVLFPNGFDQVLRYYVFLRTTVVIFFVGFV